jgi:hypothetical protein
MSSITLLLLVAVETVFCTLVLEEDKVDGGCVEVFELEV